MKVTTKEVEKAACTVLYASEFFGKDSQLGKDLSETLEVLEAYRKVLANIEAAGPKSKRKSVSMDRDKGQAGNE